MHPGPFFGGPDWTHNEIKIDILFGKFSFLFGQKCVGGSFDLDPGVKISF